MVDPISVSKDLELLVKARLVDIRMREDGEWIYSASEYSKSLTEEELTNILDNLDEYE
jgi:hypothetical protein